MASYGSQKYGRAGEGNAIVVSGFFELQRALRATELGVQREVQARIKLIGGEVMRRAIAYVPHKTGRHGADNPRTIEEGMRVGAVLRGASIYTLAVHGGAQNVGAWTRGGRGPHISRASASHYMDRAVTDSEPFVAEQTQAVLDWIDSTFQEG